MFFDSRHHPRHLVLTSAVVLLLVALLGGPARADHNQACFTTRPSDPDLGPIGDGLDRIGAIAEDLLVAVQWADDPNLPDAALTMTTPSGVTVGSWPVTRFPGEQTEHQLDGALAQVAALGFQYFLRLEDAGGIRVEAPIRAIVDCPKGEPCQYRLVRGLQAGPIVVSPDFWDALDEARGAGSSDLIGHVRDHHPELAGEIPGFVWQMEIAGTTGGDGCACRWIDVQGSAPKTRRDLDQGNGNPPNHVFGSNYRGARHLVGAQTTDGVVEVQFSKTRGTSIYGIQLLCNLPSDESTPTRYATGWPSLPFLVLDEPQIESCPAPCTPVIEHRAELLGCAQAEAYDFGGPPAQAISKIITSIGLQPLTTAGGGTRAQADTTGGPSAVSRKTFADDYTMTLQATGAIAGAESEASLWLDAETDDTGYGYAYASAAVLYLLEFEAPVTCDGIPYHQGGIDLIRPNPHEGGVAVVRWEP